MTTEAAHTRKLEEDGASAGEGGGAQPLNAPAQWVEAKNPDLSWAEIGVVVLAEEVGR